MSASSRRLGVALLFDDPVLTEIEGLRRAVGDPSLGRVAAHLTLVPPVNVRYERLPDALLVLREAAARAAGPIQLTLGPPSTFLPDNPVLFLKVGGEVDLLSSLRDAVFRPPLSRELSWPWVPHVTLADSAPPERIAAALQALDRYASVSTISFLTLLEEGHGRLWKPIAEVALGRPAVVGAGGLALEIVRGRWLDPELVAILAAGSDPTCEREKEDMDPPLGGPFTLVMTARREGRVVGASVAWLRSDGGHVAVFVPADLRRQGIGTHLLAHLEAHLTELGWTYPTLVGHGPAVFLTARSGWVYSNSTAA